MYEDEIKTALALRLRERFKKGFIYPEKTFYQAGLGNSSRIDTFFINGTKFVGYEIKSEKDDPNRLKKQIPKYEKLFNKLIILTEPCKLKKVKEIVPAYCGIIEVVKDHTGAFIFNRIQKSQDIGKQDPKLILQVLHKKEIIDYFSGILDMTKSRMYGFSKRKLISLLAKEFTLLQLRVVIANLLIKRLEENKDFIKPILKINLRNQIEE